jgi:hypothetical protein
VQFLGLFWLVFLWIFGCLRVKGEIFVGLKIEYFWGLKINILGGLKLAFFGY